MTIDSELHFSHWGSKTLLLRLRTCPRAFYFAYHAAGRSEPPASTRQVLREIGQEVGRLARQAAGDGTLVFGGQAKSLKQGKFLTWDLIRKQTERIFEAVFQHDGIIVLPDILERMSDGAYKLIEVKATPGMRTRHLLDVAVQDEVLRRCKLPVAKIEVWVVNPDYVRGSRPDLRRFFRRLDVTEKVRKESMRRRVAALIEEGQAVLRQPEPPPPELKSACYSPQRCEFFNWCWKEHRSHPAFDIPFLALPQRAAMFADDIKDPTELKKPVELSATQRLQWEYWQQGTLQVTSERVRPLIENIRWPVGALDFEYYNLVIPLFENTRPGQSTPFLYAAAIQEKPGGPMVTRHQLETSHHPPGKDFVADALQFLAGVHSVIVFDKNTEQRILRQWAERYPALADAVEHTINRMVDIQKVISPRALYHPHLGNGRSLKAAVALFMEKDPYRSLTIRDGFRAALQYYRMMEHDLSPAERDKIADDLIAYCTMDVRATLFLLNFARQQLHNAAE